MKKRCKFQIQHVAAWLALPALAWAAAQAQAQTQAQPLQRTPLPASHPLLGAWRIDVPKTGCFEMYRFKADGTMSMTSGNQAGESEFAIALQPSAKGFYRWVDHVVKDNGKPDCMGSTVKVGSVATNYIKLNADGKVFAVCQTEDFNGCAGPFVRQAADK